MNGKIMLNCTQSRRVNSLIRRECCNYAEGNCVLLDDGETHVCPQRITYSHIICKWFKNAVFPIDTQLHAELLRLDTIRYCSVCGDTYVSKARNAKYCPKCRKQVTRVQAKERMRKKRCRVTEHG